MNLTNKSASQIYSWRDKKGAVILVIPLALAIIGLVSTGVMAGIDHEKELVKQRDIKRKEDIQAVQNKLTEYNSQNNNFPFQNDEASNGYEALVNALGEVPQDPSASENISYYYWSDGQVYTLRYMLEETNEEIVVFSE